MLLTVLLTLITLLMLLTVLPSSLTQSRTLQLEAYFDPDTVLTVLLLPGLIDHRRTIGNLHIATDTLLVLFLLYSQQ